MKISGPRQHCTNNFWIVSQIRPVSRVLPWAQNKPIWLLENSLVSVTGECNANWCLVYQKRIQQVKRLIKGSQFLKCL